MDGIIINDEIYKLAKDSEDFGCSYCALEEYCNNFSTSICTSAFVHKEYHLEKVERIVKSPIEDNKQPEISNQSYFY